MPIPDQGQGGARGRLTWAHGHDTALPEQVERIFKTVKVEYWPQDRGTGKLGTPKVFAWDVTTGALLP